jgi:hypothetical protein
MASSRTLGFVSAAQLATGVAGMALAVKRRHNYDTPVKRGTPERVGRDSVFNGTALSAPVTMLIAQAVAARAALRGEPTAADTVLGGLGATMVSGYLAESLCRRRLHPSQFDTIETPLIVTALSLSIAMVVLGFKDRRRRHANP